MLAKTSAPGTSAAGHRTQAVAAFSSKSIAPSIAKITQSIVAAIAIATIATGVACSHTSSVRIQPDTVHVAPNLRPIAAIQVNAISAYLLFIPIPGVDLDRVINQMLVVAAKSMGADKVANVKFDIAPSGGVWKLREIIGWRSAKASGIAVQVTAPAPDPNQGLGPEPPVSPTPAGPAPAGAPGGPGSR